MWCCVWAWLLSANFLVLAPFGVIGSALGLALDWRRLHRFPADPDAPVMSAGELESEALAWLLVGALLITNAVVAFI